MLPEINHPFFRGCPTRSVIVGFELAVANARFETSEFPKRPNTKATSVKQKPDDNTNPPTMRMILRSARSQPGFCVTSSVANSPK